MKNQSLLLLVILMTLVFVDFLARTIMEVDKLNGNNGLDLSNFSTGVYCLIIKNANNNYKFIIQKQ